MTQYNSPNPHSIFGPWSMVIIYFSLPRKKGFELLFELTGAKRRGKEEEEGRRKDRLLGLPPLPHGADGSGESGASMPRWC